MVSMEHTILHISSPCHIVRAVERYSSLLLKENIIFGDYRHPGLGLDFGSTTITTFRLRSDTLILNCVYLPWNYLLCSWAEHLSTAAGADIQFFKRSIETPCFVFSVPELWRLLEIIQLTKWWLLVLVGPGESPCITSYFVMRSLVEIQCRLVRVCLRIMQELDPRDYP